MSQTTNPEGQPWLANNRGEAVGQADSVITRSFFAFEWVDILADFMIDPALDCWVVLQPENGPAMAVKITDRKRPSDLLSKITDITSGTRFTRVFQSQQKSQQNNNKLVLKLL